LLCCQNKLKDKAEQEKENEQAASQLDELETEEAKKLVEKLTETGTASREEESTREIVAAAARAVGSLGDLEFDITFNPDVFQDHVKHSNPDVSPYSAVSSFL
jgi:hypothetical protein